MLLTACGHNLQSESGLYNVKLERSVKSPVDGGWTWGKGNPYLGKKKGAIYVAPLNISMVVNEEPELAPLMIPQMHAYMVEELAASLKDCNRCNGTDWKLTFNPAEADIRIDTALVKFERQHPVMRVISGILRIISPVPGVGRVVGCFSTGDITIEAAIRDCRNGELLLAFKDSNHKTARLYSAEAYSRTGNADVNLKAWAHFIAKLCRLGAYDKLGNETLRQKFREYGFAEALRDRITE